MLDQIVVIVQQVKDTVRINKQLVGEYREEIDKFETELANILKIVESLRSNSGAITGKEIEDVFKRLIQLEDLVRTHALEHACNDTNTNMVLAELRERANAFSDYKELLVDVKHKHELLDLFVKDLLKQLDEFKKTTGVKQESQDKLIDACDDKCISNNSKVDKVIIVGTAIPVLLSILLGILRLISMISTLPQTGP